jgi:GNAT superfamily N-acetyltransferase
MNEYVSRRLTEEHQLDRFDCGHPVLDDWLQREAMRAQRQDTARTYVWTLSTQPWVVAYYSIAPTTVRRGDVSRSMSGGVSVIPAYLLARLALDRQLHGQGLGAELLMDALGVIVKAAGMSAGRLIVVDAIDEAAHAFYTHHDLRPIEGGMRLVMKISTARKLIQP